jgi:hypothetical protein
LRELTAAVNQRYLAFLAALEDPRAGLGKLPRVSRKVGAAGRSYGGFNFFEEEDVRVLEAIAQGQYYRVAPAHRFPGRSSGCGCTVS